MTRVYVVTLIILSQDNFNYSILGINPKEDQLEADPNRAGLYFWKSVHFLFDSV